MSIYFQAQATTLRAYLECSDALQEHAREMVRATTDESLDEEERYLAAEALDVSPAVLWPGNTE